MLDHFVPDTSVETPCTVSTSQLVDKHSRFPRWEEDSGLMVKPVAGTVEVYDSHLVNDESDLSGREELMKAKWEVVSGMK